MARFVVLSLLLLALAACVAEPRPNAGRRAPVAPLTPDSWRHPGAWDIHVIGTDEQSLGDIKLLLTDQFTKSEHCAGYPWRRAVVLEDNLQYDIGFDMQPTYEIRGPWITIDLTGTICNVGYRFLGELGDDGATGFFNYSHKMGGENIGRFVATPILN